MMKNMISSEKFSEKVINRIRNIIKEADGHEVLCVGKISSDGIVDSITIGARGNENTVPVIMDVAEKGDLVIHNHPSGALSPSTPDLRVAAHLGSQGIGFYIVDNDVKRIYSVIEPVKIKETKKIDPEPLIDILSPGGLLSKAAAYYETRDSQIEMLEFVIESFNNNLICAAEAGTGIGKSFAYLLPAVRWAEENEERVLISTATINLQQQIVEKDIPMVKSLLKSKIKAVLVKGRGNYICLRRLNSYSEENSLFNSGEEGEVLKAIKEWIKSTKTGSRSDLAIMVKQDLWRRICSESDTCMGLFCSKREKCFVLRSRREAAAANLLVVNHHLLFSDLSLRVSGMGFGTTAVLPPFSKIIFDEAHNIENSATSFFSESFSRFVLFRYISRILRKKNGRFYGLVSEINKLSEVRVSQNSIFSKIKDVQDQIFQLDESINQHLGGKKDLSINAELSEEVKELFFNGLKAFLFSLKDLLIPLGELQREVPDEDRENPHYYEYKMILRRLTEICSFCERFNAYEDDPDRVFWVEKLKSGTGDPCIRYIITPLDISGIMREAVFYPYDSIVCTSATLTTNNDFSYWMSRTGLSGIAEKTVLSKIFPSPFPYKENVLLGLPVEAPIPSDDNYSSFAASFIMKVIELSEGKALVLFTSYKMMKEVYSVVVSEFKDPGISLLIQGSDDRSRLLEKFSADTSSVLFGTDSFWEGVDIPGAALEVVIIVKLPFRVPTEPILKARMEAVKIGGGNPFMELSLPEAVMKLRQGFGRLIRRNTDRGVVIILDPRVIHKKYGSLFLKSLPETIVKKRNTAGLLVEIENFLY